MQTGSERSSTEFLFQCDQMIFGPVCIAQSSQKCDYSHADPEAATCSKYGFVQDR